MKWTQWLDEIYIQKWYLDHAENMQNISSSQTSDLSWDI